MTDSTSELQNRSRTALRTAALVAALALTLSGCASGTGDSNTPGVPPAASTDTESDSNSDEISVVGGDLVSSTVERLATTYAKGREPQPSVEFVDATTVVFAFPVGVTADEALNHCQIAYGVMSGEGIRVLMNVGDAQDDCTALVEG